MFDLIAFDADDTLWHNESIYQAVQQRYAALLAPYAGPTEVQDRLFQQEMGNLALYGYGIKSFTLSMIETAISLSQGAIHATEITQIIGFAKEMLSADVSLLDQVQETVRELTPNYRLMIITKGDLLDQTQKLSRSGLAEDFQHVEVVSHKNPAAYGEILRRYNTTPDRFLMVGNSLKSDVLPVLALGGHAVYVPYHLTWKHEVVQDEPTDTAHYHRLSHLSQLPELVARLAREDTAHRPPSL
jgi:putative hydrolase of the HAD superfamily